MNKKRTITVVGSGVAGSAIAHVLVRAGFDVRLLFRAAGEGASFTNQKWHHSGLLYPDPAVLRRAWVANQSADPLLVQHVVQSHEAARFICLRKDTFDQRKSWFEQWQVRALGLDWREMHVSELAPFSAAGGFVAPDRVVDFPALIHHLRSEVSANGGDVVEGALVTRLLFDERHRRVQGVAYCVDGHEYEVISDHTILAAGAWSIDLVDKVRGIELPKLVRKKCVVLSYRGELVPGITVCLDVAKLDGFVRDSTLVPFQGRTLAAGTDWMPVHDPDNDSPTDKEVHSLKAELAQWFPMHGQTDPMAHVCIKTEPDTGQGRPPNVQPTIYGANELRVRGLTMAFPGKASFMFELARSVAAGLIAAQRSIATDTQP